MSIEVPTSSDPPASLAPKLSPSSKTGDLGASEIYNSSQASQYDQADVDEAQLGHSSLVDAEDGQSSNQLDGPKQASEATATDIGVPLTSLWQKAMDQLPVEERRVFESKLEEFDKLQAKEVFQKLEQAAQTKKVELAKARWKIPIPLKDEKVFVRKAISKTIICLRRFKEVGDIAVSFDPTHAALPWAACRLLLEVSVMHSAWPAHENLTGSTQ